MLIITPGSTIVWISAILLCPNRVFRSQQRMHNLITNQAQTNWQRSHQVACRSFPLPTGTLIWAQLSASLTLRSHHVKPRTFRGPVSRNESYRTAHRCTSSLRRLKHLQSWPHKFSLKRWSLLYCNQGCPRPPTRSELLSKTTNQDILNFKPRSSDSHGSSKKPMTLPT